MLTVTNRVYDHRQTGAVVQRSATDNVQSLPQQPAACTLFVDTTQTDSLKSLKLRLRFTTGCYNGLVALVGQDQIINYDQDQEQPFVRLRPALPQLAANVNVSDYTSRRMKQTNNAIGHPYS